MLYYNIMFFNSYLIAILSGFFIYLVMLLDAKYIEQSGTEKISFKMPLLVTLLVWTICTFHETQIIENIPSMNALKQNIFVDRF
jgi:hypothetical protein